MASPKRTAQPRERLTLAQTMAELEAAGTEQARKTYRRHGAPDPVFGVSFATLKTLAKRIGTDHELACALWETGNFDARNLAVKIVDPQQMSLSLMDNWGRTGQVAMCMGYVACVAFESPHAAACVEAWLRDPSPGVRASGWNLVAALALRDETFADAWMEQQVATIERQIHSAPNAERAAMNSALIALGCHNPALRAVATAAALRIGPVEVDHGDTACETVEAAPRLAKTWEYSLAKGFASPAAHERSRESMRIRC